MAVVIYAIRFILKLDMGPVGMEVGLMEVRIAPEIVLQGAAVLSALPGALPSGRLPAMEGSGDVELEHALTDLEDWWRTVCATTSEDAAALHQLVTSAATAQQMRDQQAAIDIEKSSDPTVAVRMR